MTRTIVVARDFSRSPGGRTVDDGPNSGERFREQYLKPALIDGSDEVEVDLRGALSFGSSFLDEAFGGLVRRYRISPSTLHQRLTILSDLDAYATKIWSYVESAGEKEGLR